MFPPVQLGWRGEREPLGEGTVRREVRAGRWTFVEAVQFALWVRGGVRRSPATQPDIELSRGSVKMQTDGLASKFRHSRSLGGVILAAVRPQNYSGVVNAFRYCDNPIDVMQRYIRNSGEYPAEIQLKTPTGMISLEVYTPDDVQTINEIFLRGDYEVGTRNSVIVDFGSNIGVSAAYFLSRNRDAFCYCYEPLPQNIERFERNTKQFTGRCELNRVAVGESAGQVQFGWEPTGRYGGVGRETGNSIEVDCVDSNSELERVIARHERIDVLKVDIETLEKQVTERIPVSLARRIKTILVEARFEANPLSATHSMKKRVKWITAFTRN